MKAAIIAGIVSLLVSATSATAAFVVTSKNIKDGTIQTVDISAKAKAVLKGKTGPRGLAGPQGTTGPQGVPGPQGAQGPAGITSIRYRVGPAQTVPAGGFISASVACESGEVPIGGGHYWGNLSNARITHSSNYEGSSSVGWTIAIKNEGTTAFDISAFAICLRTS